MPAAAEPATPYRVLYVCPAAPLVVCEAAYRGLAKQAHSDAGGSDARMRALNTAIEAIRREKGGS